MDKNKACVYRAVPYLKEGGAKAMCAAVRQGNIVVIKEDDDTRKNMEAIAASAVFTFRVPYSEMNLYSLLPGSPEAILHRVTLLSGGKIHPSWNRVFIPGFEKTFFSLDLLLKTECAS